MTKLTKSAGKDKKRVDKSVAHTSKVEEEASAIPPDELREALDKVKNEEVPKSAEEKEQYFMSQVSMGEQLCTQGKSLGPHPCNEVSCSYRSCIPSTSRVMLLQSAPSLPVTC
jgi:hypothetical protein